MSYVTTVGLLGVPVKVSDQAARPREASRPSPGTSSKSPEMASRASRPRESTGQSATLAGKYLAQVTAAKGQEAMLTKLLASMGAELRDVEARIRRCELSNGNCSGLYTQRNDINKAISVCIAEIKRLAAKANMSATAAIKEGATRLDARAAVIRTTSGPVAVESNSAGVNANGTITVGPDAVAVTTPPLTDASLKPQDVVVSTGTIAGSLGTVAVVGIVGFIGYRIAKKRGWL